MGKEEVVAAVVLTAMMVVAVVGEKCHFQGE